MHLNYIPWRSVRKWCSGVTSVRKDEFSQTNFAHRTNSRVEMQSIEWTFVWRILSKGPCYLKEMISLWYNIKSFYHAIHKWSLHEKWISRRLWETFVLLVSVSLHYLCMKQTSYISHIKINAITFERFSCSQDILTL